MPTRFRTQGGYSTGPPALQKVYNSAGTQTSTYTWSPGGLSGQTKSIEDVVTPNFAKLRRQGSIVMNPLVMDTDTQGNTGTGFIKVGPHASWSNGWVTIEGDMSTSVESALGSAMSLESDADMVKAMAIINAYANLNSAPILGGEILGTLSETISMLRRPFSRSLELLAKIAKKRQRILKSVRSSTKASADAWLEYRYGWRPIILDGMEIMRQAGVIQSRLVKARHVARGAAVRERSFTKPVSSAIFSSAYHAEGTLTLTEKVRSSVGIIYSMRAQSNYERVARTLGLTARDLPSTVWELMPWSFVGDWFVNTGDWIQAIMPRDDVSIQSSWRTTVIDDSHTLSGGRLSRTLYNPTTTYNGTWNGRYHWHNQVTREVNPSLPSTPVLIRKSLSVNRTVDALCLSVGQIGRLLSKLRH